MSTHPKPAPKATHPLPLSSTLHDLALLRASDLDFASILPASTQQDTSTTQDGGDRAVEESVQRSVEFSRHARAALKLLHTDAVEREGTRVDDVRERVEDVVRGLEDKDE